MSRGRQVGSRNKEQKEYLNLALLPETMQVLQNEAERLCIPVRVYAASLLTRIAKETCNGKVKDS